METFPDLIGRHLKFVDDMDVEIGDKDLMTTFIKMHQSSRAIVKIVTLPQRNNF